MLRPFGEEEFEESLGKGLFELMERVRVVESEDVSGEEDV